MTSETPRELFEKGIISENQYKRLDLVPSRQLISVFYELRSMLYLGVLLFTAGMGVLIYKNIGDLGHVASIIVLSVVTVVCFWYVFRHALPYSNEAIKSPTPYFDYIVLLGSLLFISVQGYLQFQYGWLDDKLGISTLITSAFFFYIAYRFDHVGVLSLAVTALASFWSISISPQKWYSEDFFSGSHLYTTAIIFGATLAGIAVTLHQRGIKKHFTFTYLNFCLLIFFVGSVCGLFIGDIPALYIMLIYVGAVFTYFVARMERSFLFLLYGFVAAFIATTYIVGTVMQDAIELWFLYSMLSCGAFIYFLISYRNHFKQKE